MRRIASDLLAKIAIVLLIAAALARPAQAQIGPPPGGGGGTPGGTNGQVQYNNSGAFGGRAVSGTGTTIVTTTGTLNTGDCVKIDANNNMIDAGGACGGSAGVSSITTACPAGLSGVSGPVTITGAVPANEQTGTTYTVQATDCGKLLTFNNASAVAVTLPQAGTSGFLSGFFLAGVQNLGAGAVTITPTTSTINGSASLTLASRQSITGLVGDGTNYFAQVTAVPGGSSGQIQYNNSGSFGGIGAIGIGTSVVKATSLSNSSGTVIPTTTGTLTSGDCVKIDASGNLVDAGGACGGSGSPGGSNGQIQYNNSGSFGGLPVVGSGSSVVEAFSVSGNSGQVAQSTGTLMSGDCANFDGGGNVTDAGAPCNIGAIPTQSAGGLWFPLNTVPGMTPAVGSTGTVGVTYCSPFTIKRTFTFDQIAAQVQTLGTTSLHFALYASALDSTNHHYYPSGSPLVIDNNGPADTATGVVTFTFASNYQVVPGTYWACFQYGDATAKMYAISNSAGLWALYPFLVGTAGAGSSIFAGPTSIKSNTGTFGTWPISTNWTGNSWSEQTAGFVPEFAVHIVSVP